MERFAPTSSFMGQRWRQRSAELRGELWQDSPMRGEWFVICP